MSIILILSIFFLAITVWGLDFSVLKRSLCWLFRWEEIARLMQGRTATTVKNFWNALQKKLSKQDPQVSPRNPVGIGFGPTSVPDASSIPAPVSASLEPSKGDQVVEIVEDTPADQYSECFLQELLRDQEPSNCFMENIFTASPDADGSQNIIN